MGTSQMRIYLDVETIPSQDPQARQELEVDICPPGNYKNAETLARWEAEERPRKVEERWLKTSLEGDRGELVCIAWAIDDEEVRSVQRGLMSRESELLVQFYVAIEQTLMRKGHSDVTWVGHNIRDFDLRFLYQRSVVLSIQPPVYLPHDSRPGDPRVFDTMTAWSGWNKGIRLDRLCRALNLEAKGSETGEHMDGSKVWPLVKANEINKLAIYCRGDVERVRSIHHRMTFERMLAMNVSVQNG